MKLSPFTPNTISSILSRLKINPATGCAEWTGILNNKGYGYVSMNNKRVLVHRFMYEQVKGLIPRIFELDHLCRNRRCANPDHLEAVTHRENMIRGETTAASNARKTHCPKGHEYSLMNTHIAPNGGRLCRQCQFLASQKLAAKRREAKGIFSYKPRLSRRFNNTNLI